MAAPRVFVSSTCYDLRYIRENLRFFIRTLGYEPVLSEQGGVFYDPALHVQDACLADVPTCQLFIRIVGGRFGSQYKSHKTSITNNEFLAAVKAHIPVFALVEQGVYDQYHVYLANRGSKFVDAEKINYPSVDSTRVFDFISAVQAETVNNALFPFSDFEGVQSYLKQQWASMFNAFLINKNETQNVADVLHELSKTNAEIAYLSRQLLQSLGDKLVKAKLEAYDILIGSRLVRYLVDWRIKIDPSKVLEHESLDDLRCFERSIRKRELNSKACCKIGE